VNSEYVIWAAILVGVAVLALLWLVFGVLPEIGDGSAPVGPGPEPPEPPAEPPERADLPYLPGIGRSTELAAGGPSAGGPSATGSASGASSGLDGRSPAAAVTARQDRAPRFDRAGQPGAGRLAPRQAIRRGAPVVRRADPGGASAADLLAVGARPAATLTDASGVATRRVTPSSAVGSTGDAGSAPGVTWGSSTTAAPAPTPAVPESAEPEATLPGPIRGVIDPPGEHRRVASPWPKEDRGGR
jgi:hypothetical protein